MPISRREAQILVRVHICLCFLIGLGGIALPILHWGTTNEVLAAPIGVVQQPPASPSATVPVSPPPTGIAVQQETKTTVVTKTVSTTISSSKPKVRGPHKKNPLKEGLSVVTNKKRVQPVVVAKAQKKKPVHVHTVTGKVEGRASPTSVAAHRLKPSAHPRIATVRLATVPVAPNKCAYEYTVPEKGSRVNCLWRIAEANFGDDKGYLWPHILEANPKKIGWRLIIHPNQKLWIPPLHCTALAPVKGSVQKASVSQSERTRNYLDTLENRQ